MEGPNQTSVSEFILLGFTDVVELQVLLSLAFTVVYMLTLLGNIGISSLVWTDYRLHTPMYFFLINLSFLNICSSTSVTPKMLANFFSGNRAIYLSSCATQLFCFSVFGTTECLLLAVMAYDRYVAICNPLLYLVIINQRACIHLVFAAYALGFLNATVQITLTFSLSFCRSNVIDHFFCDIPPLLKLSCSETYINQVVMSAFASVLGMGSFGFVIASYYSIVRTILRIQSVQGRYKAFSTCASHVIAVSLYFGTVFVMYVQPASSSMTQNKVLSLFYSVVNAMLNPVIYSLRNQEVTRSWRKSALQHPSALNLSKARTITILTCSAASISSELIEGKNHRHPYLLCRIHRL
ncbi:olfactory receptor 5G29-like [Ambystoma mexicanum]|uniref:olfactory receptor 5G29-like n=1 Tax=Ambystoma mexicanum TaxID=8296 RepID=UPI0037E8C872